MCLGDLCEKSEHLCFPGPYDWQLKEKIGLFLLFPLWHGGVSASITPQVCLSILPLILHRYCQPCGERCSHPLQTYLSLAPQTSPLDHLGCWYNTTILTKDNDTALGQQSSQRQRMGKGCVEDWDAGMKHPELPSDLWADPSQQLQSL